MRGFGDMKREAADQRHIQVVVAGTIEVVGSCTSSVSKRVERSKRRTVGEGSGRRKLGGRNERTRGSGLSSSAGSNVADSGRV